MSTGSVNPDTFGADPTGARDSAKEINQAAAYCLEKGLKLETNKGSSYQIKLPVNMDGGDMRGCA